MSRKRAVTEDEQKLFHETLKDAKPIRLRKPRKRVEKPVVETKVAKAEIPRKAVIAPAPTPPKKTRPRSEPAVPPGISGHRQAQARRGKLEPEARLDLHGHTQDQAYSALLRFLGRARDSDRRVALVITGKSGVLHDAVPRWLAQTDFRQYISGIAPAHIRHGGGGAVYITLKRKR